MSLSLPVCCILIKIIIIVDAAPKLWQIIYDPLRSDAPRNDPSMSDDYLSNDATVPNARKYDGYEFDFSICKEVYDRILCGYNKNKGENREFETVDLGNGCVSRGDRIECGYQRGGYYVRTNDKENNISINARRLRPKTLSSDIRAADDVQPEAVTAIRIARSNTFENDTKAFLTKLVQFEPSHTKKTHKHKNNYPQLVQTNPEIQTDINARTSKVTILPKKLSMFVETKSEAKTPQSVKPEKIIIASSEIERSKDLIEALKLPISVPRSILQSKSETISSSTLTTLNHYRTPGALSSTSIIPNNSITSLLSSTSKILHESVSTKLPSTTSSTLNDHITTVLPSSTSTIVKDPIATALPAIASTTLTNHITTVFPSFDSIIIKDPITISFPSFTTKTTTEVSKDTAKASTLPSIWKGLLNKEEISKEESINQLARRISELPETNVISNSSQENIARTSLNNFKTAKKQTFFFRRNDDGTKVKTICVEQKDRIVCYDYKRI